MKLNFARGVNFEPISSCREEQYLDRQWGVLIRTETIASSIYNHPQIYAPRVRNVQRLQFSFINHPTYTDLFLYRPIFDNIIRILVGFYGDQPEKYRKTITKQQKISHPVKSCQFVCSADCLIEKKTIRKNVVFLTITVQSCD